VEIDNRGEKQDEYLYVKHYLSEDYFNKKAKEILEKESKNCDASLVRHEFDFEKKDFKETERKPL
jgi:hypothetical protein